MFSRLLAHLLSCKGHKEMHQLSLTGLISWKSRFEFSGVDCTKGCFTHHHDALGNKIALWVRFVGDKVQREEANVSLMSRTDPIDLCVLAGMDYRSKQQPALGSGYSYEFNNGLKGPNSSSTTAFPAISSSFGPIATGNSTRQDSPYSTAYNLNTQYNNNWDNSGSAGGGASNCKTGPGNGGGSDLHCFQNQNGLREPQASGGGGVRVDDLDLDLYTRMRAPLCICTRQVTIHVIVMITAGVIYLAIGGIAGYYLGKSCEYSLSISISWVLFELGAECLWVFSLQSFDFFVSVFLFVFLRTCTCIRWVLVFFQIFFLIHFCRAKLVEWNALSYCPAFFCIFGAFVARCLHPAVAVAAVVLAVWPGNYIISQLGWALPV